MTIEEIGKNLPVLFCAILVAILFIQSGLDKVFDWKGNVEWLTGHFKETFVSGMVPLMVAQITILELLTGILSAVGIFYFLITGSVILLFWTAIIGSLTIIALFFGQRIAKDYPGAAVLVPYFIVMLIMLYLTSIKN
jgi:hypothetical protein